MSPSLPPSPSHPSRWSQSIELISLCYSNCFPLAIYFTLGSIYMSVPLSHFVPASPSRQRPQACSLRLHLYSCPAARFASKEAGFISEAGNQWGGRTPVQRPTPPRDNQWARDFIDGRRGLRAETAQSALTVILKLVMGWSDRIILIVLSTVSP